VEYDVFVFMIDCIVFVANNQEQINKARRVSMVLKQEAINKTPKSTQNMRSN
jgi:hypothetical protein